MPGMLDNVKVEAYGTSMALSSIATISVRGAQLLVVSLHDQSISSEVETAIRECGLSLNPQAQGLTLPCLPFNPALLCVARLQVQANKTINIAIPKMTKEVRQQVIKLAATDRGFLGGSPTPAEHMKWVPIRRVRPCMADGGVRSSLPV